MSGRPEDLIADQALRLFDRHWTLRADGSDDWPADLWNAIAEAGFLDFLVPAERDGVGASLAETTAFLRAAGSRAVSLPLAETIVGRGVLARLGLPLPDASCPIGLVMARDKAETLAVTWAERIDTVIVLEAARARGRVAGKGMWKNIGPVFDLAGRPAGMIGLSEVAASDFVAFPLFPSSLFALLRAAAMAGAMESVLEIATGYAQQRVQFGRPIGKFQAIQQMAAELAALSAAATVAVEAAVTHPAGEFLAWSAKARASEASARVAAIAHQMIGALGYTREFTLHHFTRLLWAWRDEAGDENFWHAQLAAALAREGAQDFWAFVTACESPLA